MWAGWKHSGNLAQDTSNVVCERSGVGGYEHSGAGGYERSGAGGYRLTKETTYSSLNIDYIV